MRKYALLLVVVLAVVLVGCRGNTDPAVTETPGEVGRVDREALLDSGRAHIEAGEYDKAIRDLEAAAGQAPEDSDAHFLLGQAYNQSGQLSEAAEAFRKVLALDPESAAAHHNLG